MRIIPIVVLAAACGGPLRTTRVLGDQEYVAFADRPSGGYAPMAPPDCDAGDDACKGQWLAPVHIGDRGGTIERVLQTPDAFVVYVRQAACDAEPGPNWTLLLRRPVTSVKIVQLGTPPACPDPAPIDAPPPDTTATTGAGGDAT
jgi:hypothetical protein